MVCNWETEKKDDDNLMRESHTLCKNSKLKVLLKNFQLPEQDISEVGHVLSAGFEKLTICPEFSGTGSIND